LRNINSGTLPFFAQYSWLQMSFRLAASAGVARLHRIRALKPNPAFFENRTAGQGGVGFAHDTSQMAAVIKR
jgi:hypothetical protein